MAQSDSSVPAILIIGLARSGTTWLAKLLDSHPATLYRHEPDYSPTFPAMPILTDREQSAMYRKGLSEFSATLPYLDHVRTSGTLPIFRKVNEGIFGFQGRRAVTVATRVASKHLGNIRVPQVFQLADTNNLRVVWKSVWSVGRVGCIMQALQPIQVILIIRHPCGVISSRSQGVEQRKMVPVRPGEIRALIQASSAVGSRILAKTALYDTHDLEAYRWAVLNSHAVSNLQDRAGCLIIRYEDLCEAPYDVMSKVLQTLDMPWDNQVEQFIRRSTTSTTGRFYGLNRKAEHVDQWRRRVSRKTKKRIMEIIRDTPSGALYMD